MAQIKLSLEGANFSLTYRALMAFSGVRMDLAIGSFATPKMARGYEHAIGDYGCCNLPLGGCSICSDSWAATGFFWSSAAFHSKGQARSSTNAGGDRVLEAGGC